MEISTTCSKCDGPLENGGIQPLNILSEPILGGEHVRLCEACSNEWTAFQILAAIDEMASE